MIPCMLIGSATKDVSIEGVGPLAYKLQANRMISYYFLQTLPPIKCASPCKFHTGCYTRQLKEFKAERLLCSVSKHSAS